MPAEQAMLISFTSVILEYEAVTFMMSMSSLSPKVEIPLSWSKMKGTS